MKHRGYNGNVSSLGNSTAQKWKYQGVEHEEALEVNLMEMEFRMYDPAIARFTGIDPVTHYSMSTYNAFDNNPVYWADPSGADATSFIMDLFKNSGSGYTRYENNGDGTFDKTAEASDEEIKNGKAILIAFPDQNPKIADSNKTAQKLEEWLGDGDGKVQGAGHAGIVLVNGETGSTRYFDFGRYDRPDIAGKRGKSEGAVRSSKNYPRLKNGLAIPDWDFNKSNEANVSSIVTSLHNSKIFKNYGTIMGSLAEGLDYKAMLNLNTPPILKTKGIIHLEVMLIGLIQILIMLHIVLNLREAVQKLEALTGVFIY